jgi:UDP-N-acetyl-D-mannosaminuronate dehydrogenase
MRPRAIVAEYVHRNHDENEFCFSVNEMIESFQTLGAHVEYADPRVPQVTVGGHRLKAVDWAEADLAAYDLVLLLTAHAEFEPRRLVSEARLVVDTRNATGGLGEFRHVVRL